MNNTPLITWAVPRLSEVLPLDSDSLTQILTYAADLSKEEGADHLKNLLGDSPAAFEFISAFNSRREDPTPPARQPVSDSPSSRSPAQTPSPSSGRGSGSGGRKNKKTKPPLHSAGPPRRPENFGNVAGGYMKREQGEDYVAGGSRRAGDTLKITPRQTSAMSSRAQSPTPPATIGKPPPSAAGPLISDHLPNVKSKAAKVSRTAGGSGGGAATASSSSTKGALTTSNISDLTAVIAALEVSTNPTLGGERRKCTCYATLHPVFDAAPNCLNCGKIICSLEGLQPCSFCGTALLSNEEIQSMIRELRAERGQEKMRAHNDSLHREGGPGMAAAPATPSSGKLDAARAHRDRLLQFQAQNAKRTRVVDEAADFETPNVASTMWMTPSQRALALKKQQRIMREIEEKARPEWEKKKTIMSLDIKGGRVRKVYQAAPAETTAAVEDEVPEELTYDSGRQRTGGEAFSHNPLLAAGGLMRPIWKPTEEKGENKERKQTWRRVQDDSDNDNEQWILDGGLRGHDASTET
ncbi:putative zinc finger motif, C2HC5-type-domain-containing protein [Aspergillus cavernicola]|uniref:Zinc finger motif, C2HC5-type-domain-containing protein n=1 Tax=Aspergillus cavernicola TaxID=176166 RepID=A0ABR4IR30_9EURO